MAAGGGRLEDEAELGLVLWTTDIAGLADFLVAAGGMELLSRHPGFAELRAGRARVLLHDDAAGRGHPWYRALAREGVARGIGAELRLKVADVEAAFARALRLGALSIAPPSAAEGTRECQVMGPDGYVLGLWEEDLAGSAEPPAPARRQPVPWPTRPSSLRRP